MVNQQPEALRLAYALDVVWAGGIAPEAAAELRRLHAEMAETTRANEWLQTINARISSERDALLEALRGLVAIAADSEGVAGYHLNGDIAEWATFPEWHEAHAAIAKATEEAPW